MMCDSRYGHRNGESGETLVETLLAVLISALAMLLLAMTIQVAGHLISQGQNTAKDYYEAISDIGKVAQTGEHGNSGKVSIALNPDLKNQDADALDFDGEVTVRQWTVRKVIGDNYVVSYK